MIFFKIVPTSEIWSILNKGLEPNEDGGTWVIDSDNLSEWGKEWPIVGSPIQFLLMKYALKNINVTLLKIDTDSSYNPMYIRNFDLILKNKKSYKESFKYIHHTLLYDYNFTREILLKGIINKDCIEVVNTIHANKCLLSNVYNGSDLVNLILTATKNIPDLKVSGKLNKLKLLFKYLIWKIK